MKNFIGGIIGTLLISGNVAISNVNVLIFSYIACFVCMVLGYCFVCYIIIKSIKKFFCFFSSELGFFQWSILFILSLGSILFFVWFFRSGYLLDICKNVSLWVATHVLFPGHGEPMQINLD